MAKAKTDETKNEEKKTVKKQTQKKPAEPQKAKKAAPKKTEEAEKKQPAKKTASKKETAAETKPAKKASAPKKTQSSAKKTESAPKKRRTPAKNTPPTLDEPDYYAIRNMDTQKTGSHRRSIAERTVDWKTGKTMKQLRWLALIPLGLLALFFKYCMIGYSFTVLVICCLMGILLFYNLCDLLQGTNPKAVRTVRRMVTFILCVGLLVVGITEALIIRASFGDPKEDVDYIVVLGAKVREDGPSVSLMDRIYGARDYLEAHPEVTAVVSGGQGADEPMTEAACMYEELVKLGIDPDRIWLEENATSTWENMHFTLNLIEEKTSIRPQKLGVVSSEYHLFRAGLFAKACGIESVGIPARTSRVSQMVNHFMREVAGVWHYLLLGGQYE